MKGRKRRDVDEVRATMEEEVYPGAPFVPEDSSDFFYLTNEAQDSLLFDPFDAAFLIDEVLRLRRQVAMLAPAANVALTPDGSHRLIDGYCPDCQGGCIRGFLEPAEAVPYVEPSPIVTKP